MLQPPPEQPPEGPLGAEVEEPLTEENLALAFWPLWILPFAAVGLGFLFYAYFPDSVTNFYTGTVLPFGVTFWLGTFIAYGWAVQQLWIQTIPRKYAAWAVGGCLVLLLMVMGGPQALIDDPWLFGMVAFPGARCFLR